MEIVDVKSKVIEDMGLSMKAGPDSLIFTHCLPLCASLLGAGPDSRPVFNSHYSVRVFLNNIKYLFQGFRW